MNNIIIKMDNNYSFQLRNMIDNSIKNNDYKKAFLLFIIFVAKLDKEEIDNFVSYYKNFMLNYL